MLKTVLGGGYKSQLPTKLLTYTSIFVCTAALSAVFFSATALFTEFNSSTHAESASTELSVRLLPVLSMRIAKDVNGTLTDITDLDLNITPNAAGAFTKDNLSVLVSTNGATGYTLSMANDDTDTSMHHTDTAITTTIPSITTDGLDESSFTVNSWGYSLGNINDANQTFSAIPVSTSPTNIKVTSAPAQDSRTDVTFATKINTAVSSGTYKDTIVFSAVTNYIPNALESISTMQQMTPQVCKQANIGDQATLTDTRDNKTYVVRKLADNKCWMVQNLALGGSQAITLTPADSNVSTNFTLEPSSDDFGNSDDASSIDINRMHDNGNAWLDAITVGQTSTVHTEGVPSSQTQYMGNYYNFYTATASTGNSTTPANTTAASSICPKGWRLPNNQETYALRNAYGSNSADIFVNTSAVLSGAWYNSVAGGSTSAQRQGEYAIWMTSTAESLGRMYGMGISTTTFMAAAVYGKAAGTSVRCVVDDRTIASIDTMQAMLPNICENSAIGDSKALRDTRDGKTYMVRKMEDNKCWMTQNLALGSASSDTTLTPQDSDIAANFTIPASAVQTSGSDSWETVVDAIHVYDNGNA